MIMTRIRDLLFDGIGYILILLSPFVVGFFVAVESEHELGAVFPFNFIIAAVLEAAGIMSMHLISRVMDWNRRHEAQAPLGWAVVGALAYLGIALGIIVLLSGWPPTRHTAVKGSFVLLTLVGYMIFALYHQQVHIEQGEQTEHIADREDGRWKYETNNEYKLERLRIQMGGGKLFPVREQETVKETVKETGPHADLDVAIMAYYSEHRHATMRQVASEVGCVVSTVNKHVKRLETQGYIERNGNGVTVCNNSKPMV